MRLDRYLFFVRLLKSRTLAQALIDGGHVRLDRKRVSRASEEVRAGQVIALPLHGRVRVIRVTGIPTRRGPAREARTYYEEVEATADPENVSRKGGND